MRAIVRRENCHRYLKIYHGGYVALVAIVWRHLKLFKLNSVNSVFRPHNDALVIEDRIVHEQKQVSIGSSVQNMTCCGLGQLQALSTRERTIRHTKMQCIRAERNGPSGASRQLWATHIHYMSQHWHCKRGFKHYRLLVHNMSVKFNCRFYSLSFSYTENQKGSHLISIFLVF